MELVPNQVEQVVNHVDFVQVDVQGLLLLATVLLYYQLYMEELGGMKERVTVRIS